MQLRIPCGGTVAVVESIDKDVVMMAELTVPAMIGIFAN